MKILKVLYRSFIAVVFARIALWLIGEMILIIFPDLAVTFGRFLFCWFVLALFLAYADFLIAWDTKRLERQLSKKKRGASTVNFGRNSKLYIHSDDTFVVELPGEGYLTGAIEHEELKDNHTIYTVRFNRLTTIENFRVEHHGIDRVMHFNISNRSKQ